MKIYMTKKCIESIGFRIQTHIDDSHIPLDIIKPVSHSKIPPWKLLKPETETSLSELKKTETTPLVFGQKLAEFKIRNKLELILTLMVQMTKIKWLPLQ